MTVENPMTALNTIAALAQDITQRIDSLAFTTGSYKSLSEALTLKLIQGIDGALSVALSRVRVLRNSMSPVNSLPPEILTAIFGCLTESAKTPATVAGIASPREWVPITHVCKYWRESALGFPFMWSPIVFEPEDIVNESSLPYQCLRRSLGAPLDVQIRCDGGVDTRVWETLAARSSRLRQLRVTDLLEIDQLRHLRHEAPLLQTLHIQISPYLLDKRWAGEDLPDELPELFAGNTPALRHLHLGLFTSFSTNRFENLVVLQLSHQIYRETSDLSHLFALLQASLNLEELSLTDCDLDSAHEGPVLTDERFLPMYRLRRLAFVGCHATIVSSVLARIELGHDELALVCKDWMPSDRPLTTIFPSKAASRLYPLETVTALDIRYDSAEVVATGARTTVRLKFEHDLDVIEGIAPSLGFLFPLHAVQSLALAGIELHDVAFWRGFFGAMPVLARLALWLPPTAMDKWLGALRTGGGGAYPAPQLDMLRVFPPYAGIWETVTAMVQARADDGHRICMLNVVMSEKNRDAAIRSAFEGLDTASLELFVDRVAQDVVPEYRQELAVPEEHRTFIEQ
ncbi:uncharacterized protein PHACADRAFT_142275 [Phanerochaete carnosa HHB-10118-sp]|uniref:F-box domain-containing protein n=1 Tax=Phanerochaete carnosa (strain HHB-10118-sp) TaxID=650164 RepID=K5WCV4_PHACS|nr:uncharacterized protein PHACADRAFT_142275 [Phanerochaete carnosa HHB-10118-sp]EKM57110.1 hypothetical protein PHACADRAFT_142275 [Phanerochaete carnosa HHB-10118-sp]